MSDNVLTDPAAIRELGTLVHHLSDELAAFRRRALLAEARLKEVAGHDEGGVNLDLAARVTHLELENERLQSKLESASARTKQMLDRVRFLRQQAQGGER